MSREPVQHPARQGDAVDRAHGQARDPGVLLSVAGLDELIGVYDADGGVLGEIRYGIGKVLGRRHCSLCDLTHRGLRQRAEWQQVVRDLGVPVTLLHRNETDHDLGAVLAGRLPAVVARRGEQLEVILGPDDLAACSRDPKAFERAVKARLGSPDDPSDHR